MERPVCGIPCFEITGGDHNTGLLQVSRKGRQHQSLVTGAALIYVLFYELVLASLWEHGDRRSISMAPKPWNQNGKATY
ncbi:MAG: hypothetical protein ACI8S3_001835 [Alphaproteobacteria bacterium]|jgi:hypothetical protein